MKSCTFPKLFENPTLIAHWKIYLRVPSGHMLVPIQVTRVHLNPGFVNSGLRQMGDFQKLTFNLVFDRVVDVTGVPSIVLVAVTPLVPVEQPVPMASFVTS